MHGRRSFLLITSIAVTVGCSDSSKHNVEDVQQRLIGRWLEEFSNEGIHIKNIVTLDQAGNFTELGKSFELSGATKEEKRAGEWSFDGVNLKRKYTSLNGRLLINAQFGYVTHAVKSLKQNEFIGVDNIKAQEIRFSRVSKSDLDSIK
jgi:hypothetical protein